jgi:hypothetical protein
MSDSQPKTKEELRKAIHDNIDATKTEVKEIRRTAASTEERVQLIREKREASDKIERDLKKQIRNA